MNAIFLSRQVQAGGGKARSSAEEIDDLKRQIADMQKRLDKLSG